MTAETGAILYAKVPKTIHRALKVRAAAEDLSIASLVTAVLSDYLREPAT
jgi:predicted HicB family RNase H-like nuclease